MSDIKANEVKPVVVPEPELSPIQQEYQSWAKENPNGGFNDFIYRKNNPQPTAPDEKAIQRAKNVSTAADILSLVGQGFTASKGGLVNPNAPLASEETSAKAQALIDAYNKQREKWKEGQNVAMNRDVVLMQERERLKAQREFDRLKAIDEHKNAVDLENIRSKNRQAETDDKQLFTAAQWEAKQKADELKAKNAAKLRGELADKAEAGRNSRASQAESGRNSRFAKSEEGKDRRYNKKPSTGGLLLPGASTTTKKPKLLP